MLLQIRKYMINSPTHSAVAVQVSVLIFGEARRYASLLEACAGGIGGRLLYGTVEM